MNLVYSDGRWQLAEPKRIINAQERIRTAQERIKCEELGDAPERIEYEELGNRDKLNVGERRVQKVMNSPIKSIAIAVSKAHGIALKSILADVRTKHVCYARWHLWALAIEATTLTQNRVADLTGRDHTTLIHGVRRYKKMREAGHAALPVVNL